MTSALHRIALEALTALDPSGREQVFTHFAAPAPVETTTRRLPRLSYEQAEAVSCLTEVVVPAKNPKTSLSVGHQLSWVGHTNVVGPKGAAYAVLYANTPFGPCTWKVAAAQFAQLSRGGQADVWAVRDAAPTESVVLGAIRLVR